METDRTIAASAGESQSAICWSQTRGPSRSVERHLVRAQEWNSLGDAAPGDGLRLGRDLLAATQGLARNRGMATFARGAIGGTASARSARLGACSRGQLIGACHASGKKTGPNPTDRRKAGSKHHILTDAQGIPLASIVTGANANDVTQLLPLVQAIPPIRGKPGRPRQRPKALQGDRGYDSEPHRRLLRALAIEPIIAKRNTEHGSGLGKTRWVVERSIAWLHQFRRLKIRYERLDYLHEAFLTLGCVLICWNFLKHVID